MWDKAAIASVCFFLWSLGCWHRVGDGWCEAPFGIHLSCCNFKMDLCIQTTSPAKCTKSSEILFFLHKSQINWKIVPGSETEGDRLPWAGHQPGPAFRWGRLLLSGFKEYFQIKSGFKGFFQMKSVFKEIFSNKTFYHHWLPQVDYMGVVQEVTHKLQVKISLLKGWKYVIPGTRLAWKLERLHHWYHWYLEGCAE